ncbi:hypothetical protein [Roseibium sp.]|uniref:hypothetical protein n=1 Tax=Roseibium sp. TaxID=1936156 RepID=UPI003B513A3A
MNNPALKPSEIVPKEPDINSGVDLRQNLERQFRHSVNDAIGPQNFHALPSAENGLSVAALQLAQSLGGKGVSVPVLTGLVRLSDVLLIVAGAGAAAVIGGGSLEAGWSALFATFAAVLFTLAFFQAADVYQVSVMRQGLSQLGRVAAGWTLVFAMFALLRSTTGIGSGLPDPWIGAWFALGLTGLCLSRLVVYSLVRHWMTRGRLERRAIIVGGGTAAAELIHEIEAQPDNDIRICGIFDDRANDRSPPVVAGYTMDLQVEVGDARGMYLIT